MHTSIMMIMRSRALQKFAIIPLLLLVGFIVLFSFPAEADKSRVEFEASLTVPANTYQYNIATVYVPPEPQSVSYVGSFHVPSGEIVKFYPFNLPTFELWQEGKFQPDWVKGSHGDFGMSISTGAPSGEDIDFYLVAMNEASSSIDVKVQMTKTWHESNYLGLFTGSTIFSLGIGMFPSVVFGKNRRQIAYSGTIFVMTYLMVAFLTWAYYKSYPPYPPFTFTLIQTISGVLFFEAFPLTLLLYLLHRNNGFVYFKSWNMGKRLQIPGVFLISGYILPLVFMVLRMVSLLHHLPFNPDVLNVLNTFSVTLGGLLMLTGLVIFIGLWTTHYRRKF